MATAESRISRLSQVTVEILNIVKRSLGFKGSNELEQKLI